MIIDFHTHNFPDSLAPKAMAALLSTDLSKTGIVAHTDGTAGEAKELLRAAGIDRAVVCNIATNTRQESKVNDYAISLKGSDFFCPLGSIHPYSEYKDLELCRLAEAGIKGIKLHPDYAGVLLSDSGYDEIFSLLSAFGFFVVVHAGYDPISPEKVHATPEMFRRIAEKYPSLRLVAAHMGGFNRAEEVYSTLVGTNVYIDTSLSSLRRGERETLYKILGEHREDRILFGTDTPWANPKAELDFVLNAPIDEQRRTKILSENAKELLGLE